MDDSSATYEKQQLLQEADASMAELQVNIEKRRDDNLAVIQEARDSLLRSLDERVRMLTEKVHEEAEGSLGLIKERREKFTSLSSTLEQAVSGNSDEQITEINKQFTELQCGVVRRIFKTSEVSLSQLDSVTSSIQSLGELTCLLLPRIELSKCSVEEINVPKGKNSSFTITLRDSEGRVLGGCAGNIKVTVVASGKGKIQVHEAVSIEETASGYYVVKYTPKSIATYQVTIKVDDEQFPGSPFAVQPFWRDYSQLGKDVKIASGFNFPWGMVCGPSNEIIVTVPHKLQIIDQELKPLKEYGSEGSGQGQFRSPAGVALYSTSNATVLAVSDCRNNRIQKFSYSDTTITPIAVIGKKGDKDLEFNLPRGLTFTSDGNIIVCDSDNHRIQVVSRSNKFIRSFGSKGSDAGQFNEPYDVAVRADEIVVADRLNHRVQCFTMVGKFVKVLGIADNQFPRGVFITADQSIIITAGSGGSEKIVVVKEGEKLVAYGKKGREAGEFNLPMGITMDNEGRVVVADHWNKRIVVLT